MNSKEKKNKERIRWIRAAPGSGSPPAAECRKPGGRLALCVLPFRNPFLSICSWSSQDCCLHPTGHSLWMEPQPCLVPLDLLYQPVPGLSARISTAKPIGMGVVHSVHAG